MVSSAANVTVAMSVLHSPSLRLCKARFSPFVVRHTFLLSKRARHIHTAGHVSSPRCSVRAARPNSWCPCPLCNPLKYSTRQKKTWYCGAQSLHKSSWTVELTIQELSFHSRLLKKVTRSSGCSSDVVSKLIGMCYPPPTGNTDSREPSPLRRRFPTRRSLFLVHVGGFHAIPRRRRIRLWCRHRSAALRTRGVCSSPSFPRKPAVQFGFVCRHVSEYRKQRYWSVRQGLVPACF